MEGRNLVYLQCEALQPEPFEVVVPQWLAVKIDLEWIRKAARLAVLVEEHELRDASIEVEVAAIGNTALGVEVSARQVRLLIDGQGLFSIRANEKTTWAEFATQAMPLEPFIGQVEAGEQFFGDDGFEAFVREQVEEHEEVPA